MDLGERKLMRKKVMTLAATAAFAAGLLAGCATGQAPGVAATVNGEQITQGTLDDAMALAPFYANPVQPTAMLSNLIQAPVVISVAQSAGIGVSDADAGAFLDELQAQAIQVDGQYTDAVLDLVRVNEISGKVQTQPNADELLVELTTAIAEANVVVNPRYGTWDSDQLGAVFTPPAWITTAGAQ